MIHLLGLLLLFLEQTSRVVPLLLKLQPHPCTRVLIQAQEGNQLRLQSWKCMRSLHLRLDLSKEQKKAKGDFPGPCPVVYYPPLSTTDEAGVEAARDAGADAVVLRAECLALASAVAGHGMDVIWDCRSPDEIAALEAAAPAASRIVLLPGADVVASVGMLEALPADALAIASAACQVTRAASSFSGGPCRRAAAGVTERVMHAAATRRHLPPQAWTPASSTASSSYPHTPDNTGPNRPPMDTPLRV